MVPLADAAGTHHGSVDLTGIRLRVHLLLAFVVHLDLRYGIGIGILGPDVQCVDSRLQLGFKLRLEVVGGLLDLDGDEIAGFSLETSLHFPADLISFSFFSELTCRFALPGLVLS